MITKGEKDISTLIYYASIYTYFELFINYHITTSYNLSKSWARLKFKVSKVLSEHKIFYSMSSWLHYMLSIVGNSQTLNSFVNFSWYKLFQFSVFFFLYIIHKISSFWDFSDGLQTF